jgi:hypothetical protein
MSKKNFDVSYGLINESGETIFSKNQRTSSDYHFTSLEPCNNQFFAEIEINGINSNTARVVLYHLPFPRSTSLLALAVAAPRRSRPSSLHRIEPRHPCRPLAGAALPCWTHPPLTCGKLRPSPASTVHCLVVNVCITGLMCAYHAPRQRENCVCICKFV